MSKQPIATAPKDGRKVTIYWTDFDGQENQSVGQYRSLEQLKKAGGDWDSGDEGWWVFTDSSTLKKVEPSGWSRPGADDEDE